MPVIVAHTDTPGSAPLSDGAPIDSAPAPTDTWQAPAVAAAVVAAFGMVLVLLAARSNRAAQQAARRRRSAQAHQALLEAVDSGLRARA